MIILMTGYKTHLIVIIPDMEIDQEKRMFLQQFDCQYYLKSFLHSTLLNPVHEEMHYDQ